MQQSADFTDGLRVKEKTAEEDEDKEPLCPMDLAVQRGFPLGWLSYSTVSWAKPLLQLGASRTLTEKDLLGIGRNQKRSGVATCLLEK